MRTCEEYRELISLAIDNEIAPDEMRDLQRHLLVCEECRNVYRAFAALSDSLADSLSVAPEDFTEGVMSRIGAQSQPARKKRFAWGRFAAVAACFVIVAAAASKIGLDGWQSRSGESAAAPADYAVSDDVNAESYAPAEPEEEQEDSSMNSVLYDSYPQEDTADGSGTVDSDSPAEATPAPEASLQDQETQELPESGQQQKTDGNSTDATESNSPTSNCADSPEEAMAMLTGLTEAEIYTGDVSESSSSEPDVTTTNTDSLAALAELLSFSELSQEERPQDEPLFTVVAQDSENGKFEIRIWLSGSKLIIEFGENGTLYVANGTFADLLEFIENA